MADNRSANLLATAVATLRNEILPAIDDPVSRIKIDQVTRLIWDVAARLSGRDTGLREVIDGLAELVSIPSPPSGADGEQLERKRAEAEALVAAKLPEWFAEAGSEGHKALARLVEIERAFYVAQDPDVANGSAVVYRGGRIEAERAPSDQAVGLRVTEESLTAYLCERFGRGDVSASDIRRIPGGFSKETLFFVLHDAASGERQSLVIRKDLPVPLIEKTVASEFPLLRQLYAQGFPVAEPLWLEQDATRFGGGFLVSRRAAGTSDVAQWSSDPARVKVACTELARILAELHSRDPETLGIAPKLASLSAGALMVREIEHWIDLFHRKRGEAFPLQEMPLVWLKANVPPVLFERPARVVHGDVGFHNLMFDEAGKITALLDWEFSILGDPTQDMCFVRQFVEPLMEWDDFTAVYLAMGGPAPCDEAAFFYDLWTRTRNAVGCVDAQTLFDQHMPNEMRFALAGHIFAPYMFIDQCELLLNHLASQAQP